METRFESSIDLTFIFEKTESKKDLEEAEEAVSSLDGQLSHLDFDLNISKNHIIDPNFKVKISPTKRLIYLKCITSDEI